jgi:hypothetical protein
MVDSRQVWVSLYRRGPANTWLDMTHTHIDDVVHLVSIDLEISLGHLYRGIDFRKKRKRSR